MILEADVDLVVASDGHTLIGGSPVTVVRLSAAAVPLVTKLDAGVASESLTAAERRAVERLVAVGMVHPRPRRSDCIDAVAEDLGVVVPVRDRPTELHRCLAALHRSGLRRIVVCDDGSTDAAMHAAVASEFGAEMVRRSTPGGPSAARIAGAAALDTPLLAFVDSDVEVTPGWWRPLVAILHDADPWCSRIGAIAPRVVADRPDSVLGRYEATSSPLDLGGRPSAIRRAALVSYVPAAALIVRRQAFDDVGGFDSSLTVGEDVDLVWRLADAGWESRYEPSGLVRHATDRTWLHTLARRRDYGASAAVLDRGHDDAVPALTLTPWSLAVLAALASGHPFIAAAVAARSAQKLATRLADVPGANEVAIRLTGRGHAHAIRRAGRSLLRPWWPIALPVAALSRRARRLLLAGTAVSLMAEWRSRRPAIDPLRFAAATVADDMAYGAGVWRGTFESGHYGALMMRIDRHVR